MVSAIGAENLILLHGLKFRKLTLSVQFIELFCVSNKGKRKAYDMKNISLILTFFALTFLPAFVNAQSAEMLAGKVWKMTDCSETADDYFFFDGGNVISVRKGGKDKVFVRLGKWKMSGKTKIALTWDKFFRAKLDEGQSEEKYVCVVERVKNVNQDLNLQPDKAGCGKLESHNRFFDINAFLRTNFKGNFDFLSEREITETELEKLSRAELGIIRNEILARYGFSFDNPFVTDYLNRTGNYENRLITDVDAFLSETEKSNIAKIKAFEAKKQ